MAELSGVGFIYHGLLVIDYELLVIYDIDSNLPCVEGADDRRPEQAGSRKVAQLSGVGFMEVEPCPSTHKTTWTTFEVEVDPLIQSGTARAEDAQGTPAQSHISPSLRVYEDNWSRYARISGHDVLRSLLSGTGVPRS